MATPPLALVSPPAARPTASPDSPQQRLPPPLGSPVLGKGSFGSVNLVRDPHSAALTALKSVRKDAPKRGTVVPYECAKSEAEALRAIGPHPHIVKLLDSYDADDCYCLVLEYYPGGDMLQYLRKHGALAELQAASMFKQLLSAVSHMHAKGYIHRDLKLENLFLSADRSRVAVGDFGFAGRWAPGQKQSASWGSVHYSAPEICTGKAYEGPEVDAWSLGCCLYGMLHASLPFDAKTIHHTFEKIEAGLYAPLRRGLSVDAQNLIMRLLQPNPAHRITIAKALVHPWLRDVALMTRGGSVPDLSSSRPAHPELFRPMSAASQLRAAGLSPSIVPEPPAAVAVPDNDSSSSASSASASSSASSVASLNDGDDDDDAPTQPAPLALP